MSEEEEETKRFIEPLAAVKEEEFDSAKVVSMGGDADNKIMLPEKKPSCSSFPLIDLNMQTIKMKNDLNNWKEIILLMKGVLLWNKPWYPESIIGVTTIFFTFFWLASPSILTFVSFMGIVVTLADYFVPVFAASYFKPEQWNKSKDQQFEEICRNFIVYRTKFCFACQNYYTLRSTKPKVFYSCTILSLVILSWLGCKISNWFLAYIVILTILMIPGLEAKGYIKICKTEFRNRCGNYTDRVFQTLNGIFNSPSTPRLKEE